jgi:hypothetical protein
MFRRLAALAALPAALCALPAHAAVIDFTGGTVTLLNNTTVVTSNNINYQGVDYYEQAGFKLDFLPNSGSAGFSTNIGNYYGGGNDVIHAHWESGNFGNVTAIEITKIGGGTFDLNYFVLTSNTFQGGGPANGTELAFVEGFVNNVSTGVMQLPPENWGFPAQQIFLNSLFDAVDTVRFFVSSNVDCFGMDSFFIDEEAPGTVSEPGSLALAGLSLLALGAARRRRAAKA